MYCSSCGTSVTHGLAYCNQCGEKLVTTQNAVSKVPEVTPDSLVWAIVVVFVAGLGVTIGLAAVLKNVLNFGNSLLIFFTLLSFALWTTIETVFIWMLLSRNRAAKDRLAPAGLDKQTKELHAPNQHTLPEPVASVTEEATRTFEPVYRERK